MKFFRHYKNKPYKLIGTVKHSETLEDLTLYETRYENNLGKLWVRPKEMFFQNVTIQGKSQPRFREIPLRIDAKTVISKGEIEIIGALMAKIFGDWDEVSFFSTLNNHNKFHLLIGSAEEKPVAFKLGYEINSKEFYSWLGGVDPEYRDLGIASDLMLAQHDWCRSQGYAIVQTKTQNRFREMLILNLKHGFDIIGMHTTSEGDLKIILRKAIEGFGQSPRP